MIPKRPLFVASLLAASFAVFSSVPESAMAAEEVKPECATLLEKASGFARYDVTYPQARADLKECSAGHCTGNRALVDVCKATLKKLDDTVPIFVKVKADKNAPKSAKILVDGEPAQAPQVSGNLGYRVKAGHHTILVTAEGYADGQRDIDVDPNADDAARTFDIRLTRPVAASPAPVPPPPPTAPRGPHTPTPQEPPTSEPSPTETKAPSGFPYRPVALAAGIVGLAGVGFGLGFGASASQKKDAAACDAESRCPTDGQTDTLLAAKNAGIASTIFVVAGGALFAGGVVLWFMKPSEKTVSLAPDIGPGHAGLFARGQF